MVGRGRMVLNCKGFKWLNGFKWPRRHHLERILRDLEAIESEDARDIIRADDILVDIFHLDFNDDNIEEIQYTL